MHCSHFGTSVREALRCGMLARMPPETTAMLPAVYWVLSVSRVLSLVLKAEIYLNSQNDLRSLVILSPSFLKGEG
jgi:hypothetical protein